MLNQTQTHSAVETTATSTSDCLAPVLFAHTPEQASQYCSMLGEINIPAVVGDHSGGQMRGLGIPVLVPESLYERASEILAIDQSFDLDSDLDDDDDDDLALDDDDDDDDDLDDEDDDEDD
jgi:hypothetical protein